MFDQPLLFVVVLGLLAWQYGPVLLALWQPSASVADIPSDAEARACLVRVRLRMLALGGRLQDVDTLLDPVSLSLQKDGL